jgi:hypothetical protein
MQYLVNQFFFSGNCVLLSEIFEAITVCVRPLNDSSKRRGDGRRLNVWLRLQFHILHSKTYLEALYV